MATERRLIDANDALGVLCNCCGVEGCCPKGGCAEYQKISKLPTVDAVDVVHGRWIETLVPDGYVQKASRMRKQCSVCGWTNACRYHYCPNCGAKMDGDGNA